MTTVTGLTAARMLAIEAASVVDGDVVGDNLHLITHGGTVIDAGSVRGPMGPSGSAFTICTSTTRPSGLTGIDEGLAIWETDTNLMRVWTGGRWQCQPRVVCTSTTRPAGFTTADEGVKIYEQDTGREYTWNGADWIKDDRPYLLNEIIRTADSTTITNTEHEFTGYDEAINVVAGRQYWVEFGYRINATGVMDAMFSVWNGAVGTGTKIAHAELHLSTSPEWKSVKMPLFTGTDFPVGGHTVRFSGRSLTSGQTFVVTGDPDWPGYYQLIERR